MGADLFKQSTSRQFDQSDCGVACLKSIAKYYGSDVGLEQLRQWSGTTAKGTSLLGLQQAAEEIGLNANGFQAGIDDLKSCQNFCILHLLIDKQMEHYMVYWEYDEASDTFLLGDPAIGTTKKYSSEELAAIWPSGKLLLFEGNPDSPESSEEVEVEEKAVLKSKHAWIWEFIKEDQGLLFIAVVLGLMVSILGLSTAIFSQQLVDSIIPSRSMERLLGGVFVLLLLLIAKAGINYTRSFFLVRQARDFNIRIIDYFFTSLINLPKRFFDTRKTGDVVARMHDTVRIQRTISSIFSSAIIDLILLFVSMATIAIYDWRVALIIMAFLPIFFWVGYRFHRPVLEGQKNMMLTFAQAESSFIDSVQGVAVIKIFNRQKIFSDAIRSVYQFFQQASFALSKTTIGFSFWVETVSATLVVCTLLSVSYLVFNGALTLGSVLAILQLSFIVTGAIGGLLSAFVQIREAEIAFDRMKEFTELDGEFSINDQTELQKVSAPKTISFDEVGFGFRGRLPLFDRVNLSLNLGELSILLGPTGSGKSTLLQLLQKFYVEYSGKIFVDDTDLTLIDTSNWRSNLGVVEQETKIFNTTIADNILMGENIKSVTVLEDFLKDHDLFEFLDAFPDGLSTIVGKNGVSPSGGQKQIIGLARALWQKPKFLLLDEPTASLDAKTEERVFDLLLRIKHRMGIFLLTHHEHLASKANQVYVLKDGVLSDLSSGS